MKGGVVPLLGLWCYVFACVLAAMCLVGFERDSKRSVIDVMLVIDVTQSMLVEDVRDRGELMSRLAFAKRASQEMLLKWPCGSRLALAIFSGHRSFVMFKSMEICAHHEELWASIEAIDWRTAWIARSEVSKGLYSALKVLPQVSESAKLVFISDGHEAPPLHEIYRPKLSASIIKRGGLIVGVGGAFAQRIPKYGPNGESQGFWRAYEVLQVDTYRMGRGNGEALVGVDQSDLSQRLANGREHLSSLKSAHLRSLSVQTEMRYVATSSVHEFEQALSSTDLWREIKSKQPIAVVLGPLALVCVLLRLLLPYGVNLRSR